MGARRAHPHLRAPPWADWAEGLACRFSHLLLNILLPPYHGQFSPLWPLQLNMVVHGPAFETSFTCGLT